ncbi:MAG TPA: hypothetical protein VFN57_19400, partial [Thermomicrobiaceae bacterium]|nr:hypothetical protein [Thermomicrobiaceae bacterium]
TLAADQETINLKNLTTQLTNAITNNTLGHGPEHGPGRGGFGPMGGWGHPNGGTTSQTPKGPTA